MKRQPGEKWYENFFNCCGINWAEIGMQGDISICPKCEHQLEPYTSELFRR